MEKLIGFKSRGGKAYYKVKWLNDPSTTWQPRADVSDDLVREYHATHTYKGKKRKNNSRTRIFRRQ